MMKKILYLFVLILSSTNVLAQDFDSTLNLIRELKDSTQSVLTNPNTERIASENKFRLQVIDSTLTEANNLVLLVQQASSKNRLDSTSYLTPINKYLGAYRTAILDNSGKKVSITTSSFIKKITDLGAYIKNTNETIAKLLPTFDEDEKGAAGESDSELSGILGVLFSGEGKDTIATFKKSDEGLLVGNIDNNKVVVCKKEYYAMIITCALFWLIVIMALLYFFVRVFRSLTKKVPEEEQGPIESLKAELEDIKNSFKKEYINSANDIKRINVAIQVITGKISEIEKDLREKKTYLTESNDSYRHDIKDFPERTKKILQPQIVKLYGNLSQDGSMIYKASNEPREDLIYQINLKNATDSDGELVIREDLSSEKMAQVINDRATYLMSSACQILADSENAYHIETVSKGFVQRVGYDWKIVNPVQVKLV